MTQARPWEELLFCYLARGSHAIGDLEYLATTVAMSVRYQVFRCLCTSLGNARKINLEMSMY